MKIVQLAAGALVCLAVGFAASYARAADAEGHMTAQQQERIQAIASACKASIEQKEASIVAQAKADDKPVTYSVTGTDGAVEGCTISNAATDPTLADLFVAVPDRPPTPPQAPAPEPPAPPHYQGPKLLTPT